MENECFFETFKRAFLTGAGYALSVVFTSKLSEFAGIFKTRTETEFTNGCCNCNCAQNEDDYVSDSEDLVSKDDTKITSDNSKNIKDLLNKL